MKRLLAAVAAAASGGRVVTRWSIAVALPLSLTVMGSQSTATPPDDRLLAGVATWLSFALALLAIGAMERRARNPAVRRSVVAVGVPVVAALRPFVQDAWLAVVGGVPLPPEHVPFRVATNVVVWTVVLTATALIVDAVRSGRETNALLRGVLAEIDAAQSRTDAVTGRARDAVIRAVTELGGDIAAVPATSAAVLRLSADRIRPWSHTLAELADAPAPGVSASPFSARHRPPRSMLLRLPPAGIVAVLYVACLLPYAARASSPVEIVVSALVAVVGGVGVDVVARRRWVSPRRAIGVFLALSVAVGMVLTVIASGFGAPGSAGWVPLGVYSAIALGAAVCAGSLHLLRVEQRRLSAAVVTEQRAMRTGTAAARAALRRAAELLHRDGQGQCTVFVLEHPTPSPTDIARLVDRLRALLRNVADVFDTAEQMDAGASLDALAATWGRVIDLTVRISPAARTALDADAMVAQDVYDVAAEGILNAVKHTTEHRADIAVDLIATGAGPRLRVRVLSFGVPPRGVTLRPGSHVRARGAALRSTPDGALLEAAFAVSTPTHTGPVVSAEHRAEPPIPRS